VDYFQAALVSVGVSLSSARLPAKVDKIRAGTPAFHAGLRTADRVLEGSVENNMVVLALERGGKKYTAKLPVNLRALRAMTDPGKVGSLDHLQALRKNTASSPGGRRKLHGFLNEAESDQILGNYDIVILIDRSGSMDEPIALSPIPDARLRDFRSPWHSDINNLSNSGETKWEWCQSQVTNLSSSIPGKFNKPMPIIPFDNEFNLIRSANITDIERVFREYKPRGGTDLGTPLRKALSLRALDQARPLLIAVITDGQYNIGPSVAEIITRAANGITRPGEIVISFLQVGDSDGGFENISHLDNELTYNGACFDIVDATYFIDLKTVGLKRALATAIRDCIHLKR